MAAAPEYPPPPGPYQVGPVAAQSPADVAAPSRQRRPGLLLPDDGPSGGALNEYAGERLFGAPVDEPSPVRSATADAVPDRAIDRRPAAAPDGQPFRPDAAGPGGFAGFPPAFAPTPGYPSAHGNPQADPYAAATGPADHGAPRDAQTAAGRAAATPGPNMPMSGPPPRPAEPLAPMFRPRELPVDQPGVISPGR